MKITFGQIKSVLAKVTNLTASDNRVKDYCNRAVERLLMEGKWIDTTARFAVCTAEHCLVWPREIETIESVHVCGSPVTIRGPWYEALENGPGLMQTDLCGPCLTLIDRGNTVTFAWITATGYKLAIYADGTESAGTVLIKYYESNANKVYTTYLGSVIEGERLTIPAAGNYTFGTYEVLPGGIYEIQKPQTNRVIRLYASKISDGSLIPLGYYAPDELVPVYRYSYLTTLGGGSCDATQVTVIGKLRFIPVVNDDSVLMISHTDAIRLAVQAVAKEENNLLPEAATYWTMAIDCLSKQLRHYRGSGQVDPIRFVGPFSYGGGIQNIV